MPRLPVLSGQEMIRYLVKKGFEVRRIRGSHAILRQGNQMTVVPLHGELDRGLLVEILRQAGIDKEQFVQEWYKQ